ncbi:hypothetical protein ECEC1865_6465, partial [Escherichia coli EC1865]
MRRNA